MVIVELEDAVRPEQKAVARAAAVEALKGDFGGAIKALRINGAGTAWHDDDVQAAALSEAQFVVIPKVESAAAAGQLASRICHPLLAMVETARGLQAAAAIAGAWGVAGLIAGTNDIAADLKLPADPERQGLMLALQTILLAARGADGWALDGVYNQIADPAGLEAEAQQGRRWGFDGKTLIHPAQVAIANTAFGPSAAEIEESEALLAAAAAHPAGIGALRFRDQMIEDMHIDTARALLARGRTEG